MKTTVTTQRWLQTNSLLHTAVICEDVQQVKLFLAASDTVKLEGIDKYGRTPLFLAVFSNHLEIMELLLKSGAKVNALDCFRRLPLHYAAINNCISCMKLLLSSNEVHYKTKNSHNKARNEMILAQDSQGLTPLHFASTHTNSISLQYLLKYTLHGAIDCIDHMKRTPLHWAAIYGSDESTKLLLKYGANGLLADQEGKTPLHWASFVSTNNAKDCVKCLIAVSPAAVDWQDFDGFSALHLATISNNFELVELLISAPKCLVNIVDHHFRTPLHWACDGGHKDIVCLLLDAGADINCGDSHKTTPLHYAAKNDHSHIVELLVQRVHGSQATTKEGHTALHWAAATGASSCIAIMVRHSATLMQTDADGCTALHIAALKGHYKAVNTIIRLKTPLDVCASNGCTPLIYAAKEGHMQIVKLLLQNHASLHHTDNQGMNCLHYTVIGGHLYLAQILIKSGLPVNSSDSYGQTALHYATAKGFADLMCLLLENGADVNAVDNQGRSCLHLAASEGHYSAVNTLLDYNVEVNVVDGSEERLTAVDCALKTEHLGLVQVLTSAGGFSSCVEKELAARCIQKYWRGWQKRNGKKRGANNIVLINFLKKVKHLHERRKRNMNNHPHLKTPFPKQIQRPKSASVSEIKPTHNRRTWGVASALVNASRRRSEHKLEIPDLSHMGMQQHRRYSLPETPKTNELNLSHDDYAFVSKAIYGPSIEIAKALQQPGNIASAVAILGNHENSQQSMHSSLDEDESLFWEYASGAPESIEDGNSDRDLSDEDIRHLVFGDGREMTVRMPKGEELQAAISEYQQMLAALEITSEPPSKHNTSCSSDSG